MKILWLLPSHLLRLLNEGETPEAVLLNIFFASTRLRVGVAASYCCERGAANVYLDPEDRQAVRQLGMAGIDICVVSKFTRSEKPDAWLEILRRIRDAGKPVLLDLCEFPFGDPERKPVEQFYSKAFALADMLTVNSSRMQTLIRDFFRDEVVLIDDAILEPPRVPKFSPARPLRALWFGHPSNFPYLDKFLPTLAEFSRRSPVTLKVVSDPVILPYLQRTARGAAAGITGLEFQPWSLDAQREALAATDVVLIPGDPTDSRKAGVSSNRLAETLQAGRFAIASPMESYLPFQDVAWVGEKLTDGLRFALDHPKKVLDQIERGQQRVSSNLSADVIGEKWHAIFGRSSLQQGREKRFAGLLNYWKTLFGNRESQ